MDTVDPRSHVSSDRSPIVVGLDGSPAAAEALRWAAWVSQMTSAPLSVLHVYTSDESVPPASRSDRTDARHAQEALARTHATRWLRDALADSSALPYGLRLVVVGGRPATVLTQVSRTASMLVLGRGEDGPGRAPGHTRHGVGEACLAQADCPVVAVKAPGVPAASSGSVHATATTPVIGVQAGGTLVGETRARS